MTVDKHALALSKQTSSHSYHEIVTAINWLVGFKVAARSDAKQWVAEWVHDPEVTSLLDRADEEIRAATASQ